VGKLAAPFYRKEHNKAGKISQSNISNYGSNYTENKDGACRLQDPQTSKVLEINLAGTNDTSTSNCTKYNQNEVMEKNQKDSKSQTSTRKVKMVLGKQAICSRLSQVTPPRSDTNAT